MMNKMWWPQMIYGKPRNILLIYPHYKKKNKKPTKQTKAQTKKTKPDKTTKKISPENLKKQKILEENILRRAQLKYAEGKGG